MEEILTVINSEMEGLELNYEFERMTQSPPKYPYWVGDYTESEPITEDGEESFTFFLNGFARGNVSSLEIERTKIKNYFKHGISVFTESGVAVSISFGGSFSTPLEENDLKKCQITLQIKIWKGQ